MGAVFRPPLSEEHDQRSQDFANFMGVIFVQMVVFILLPLLRRRRKATTNILIFKSSGVTIIFHAAEGSVNGR